MLLQIKLAGIRLTMAHSESQALKQGWTTGAQAAGVQEIKDELQVCTFNFTSVLKRSIFHSVLCFIVSCEANPAPTSGGEAAADVVRPAKRRGDDAVITSASQGRSQDKARVPDLSLVKVATHMVTMVTAGVTGITGLRRFSKKRHKVERSKNIHMKSRTRSTVPDRFIRPWF